MRSRAKLAALATSALACVAAAPAPTVKPPAARTAPAKPPASRLGPLRPPAAAAATKTPHAAAKPKPKTAKTSAPAAAVSPIVRYWLSAATDSGFSAAMPDASGRFSKAALSGVMAGRSLASGAFTHSLTAQLGSPAAPQGPPSATYVPPLGVGLPNGAPLSIPALAVEPPGLGGPGKSLIALRQGRVLLYWGCGEHAGPKQPFVIDFTKLAPGAPIPRPGKIRIPAEQPPSLLNSRTYAAWSSRASHTAIAPDASIAGPHLVRGSYLPDIRFTLPPAQDFMPPLRLVSGGATPAGALKLGWAPIPSATGYYLSLVGAQQPNGDAVIWSSSETPVLATAGFGLSDYLAPADVKKLIVEKVALGPKSAACVVPAEAAKGAPRGIVSMIAYGPEANFASPLKAKPRWAVKVRFRSTTNLLLGLDAAKPAPSPSHQILSAEASDRLPASSVSPPR